MSKGALPALVWLVRSNFIYAEGPCQQLLRRRRRAAMVTCFRPGLCQGFAKEFSGHSAGPCHALRQLGIFVGRLGVSLQYLYPLTVGEKSDISIQLCSHLFIKSVGQDFLDIFCYIMIDFNLTHLEHTCQWS